MGIKTSKTKKDEKMDHISKLDGAKRYIDIKDEIKDLDIFFFSSDDFLSLAIRSAELLSTGNGDFSHMGVVLSTDVIPGLKGAEEGEKYLLESTWTYPAKPGEVLNPVDISSGDYVFGVQIRKLEDVINKHLDYKGGRVVWAKLSNNPIDIRDGESESEFNIRLSELRKIITKFEKKYHFTLYELNPVDIIGAFNWCNCLQATFTSGDNFIFCSEIVTLLYQCIGILNPKINPGKMLPIDFYLPQLSNEYTEGLIDGKIIEKPVDIYN